MTTLAGDLYLAVAAYGLAIAVSYAGLPVLGQSAFVAVGAFGTVQLAAHGTPLGVAVLAAVVLAALAGYLVGFAAARLDGAPLALATWGLAWLGYEVLTLFPTLSGGSQGLVRETPARLVSPSLGIVVTLHPWVHVVLAAAVVVALAAALRRADRGPWGLDWAALRTGPALAESLGIPVRRRRRAVLAAAAAIGALAGAGNAVLLGVVAPVDYSPLLALQLFVAVLVGGVATWWGPALGVALLAALPSTADAIASAAGLDPLRARAVLTAALLVGVLAVRGSVGHRLGALVPRARDAVAVYRAAPSDVGMPADRSVVLALRAVSASYGAVRALDDLDLDLRAGEVHAVIGPNGGGKSTALRVATGVVAPSSGSVEVGGVAVAVPVGVAARVRGGVVRTLQRTATLGDLSAARQVEIGTRASEREGWLGLRDLLGTPVARAAAARRAANASAALEVVGLGPRAHVAAGRLDSAEQRLLQVARAVATNARAVLVDEPAAGMSRPERDRLADALRRIAASGRGVMLVEHDMGLVGRVADRVTVIADGTVLATGSIAEIRADHAVARAYLGAAYGVEAMTETAAPNG